MAHTHTLWILSHLWSCRLLLVDVSSVNWKLKPTDQLQSGLSGPRAHFLSCKKIIIHIIHSRSLEEEHLKPKLRLDSRKVSQKIIRTFFKVLLSVYILTLKNK